ncbi:MAG TPA: hypothetical protein VFC85_09385 [Verrucomicrobiae bacterium]|nr:hypothetical protein [Verrucomicrobiae bacterium]
MNYHDYHLRSYSVSDFGKTITLDLVYDYPNSPKDESKIEFSEVVAYNFIHSGGAIILDITETPLSKISKEVEIDLINYAHQFGGTIIKFQNGLELNKAMLEKEGYKLWTIWSAIGFGGIIIAKSVK